MEDCSCQSIIFPGDEALNVTATYDTLVHGAMSAGGERAGTGIGLGPAGSASISHHGTFVADFFGAMSQVETGNQCDQVADAGEIQPLFMNHVSDAANFFQFKIRVQPMA